jgi:hypothetical protein
MSEIKMFDFVSNLLTHIFWKHPINLKELFI